MNILLVILFGIILLYLSITERFRIHTKLIGLQGFILFALALFELESMTAGNLIFVASETLIFKGIAVPFFLLKIIKKTGEERVPKNDFHALYSLIMVSVGLILSIIIAYTMTIKLINTTYFIVALFGLFTGMFMIITHKKIFSHIVGFLIIENAVFLLSLAIGKQMPMLINIAVLLDIFASILLLGIFAMKLKQNIGELTILKDE
jgi:hydrogenase-4 component E